MALEDHAANAMKRDTVTLLCAALAGLLLGAVSQLPSARKREAAPPPSPSKYDPPRSGQNSTESNVASVLSLLHGEMDLNDLARLGETMTELSPSEFRQFLDYLERNATGQDDDRLLWIFTWWQKRNPEAAMEWLKPRLIMASQDGALGHLFESTPRAKVILSWASSDPERAIAFAREHPSSGLASHLLQSAIRASSERDRGVHLALLLEFPPRTRRKPIEDLLQRWAGTDGPAALAAAEALRDPVEREACAAKVLQGWSDQDPLAAFEQFRRLDPQDPLTTANLIHSVGKVSPQAAVDWLHSLDDADFSRWAPKVVETWAKADPVAALEFAVQNGVGLGPRYQPPRTRSDHDSLRRFGSSSVETAHPLAVALRAHPQKTLEWIQHLPQGPDRTRLVELVVPSTPKLEQALALFASLPAEAAARAARTIASRSDSPNAIRDWVKSLPPGKARENAWAGLGATSEQPFDLPRGADRDAMLSGLAFSRTGMNDPVFALKQSLMIDDPQLREDTFENAMEFATEFQSAKVSELKSWLEAADVPEPWKARWRGSLESAGR